MLSNFFCSPYLSSKTFLLPSILFFPRMTFYSQKTLQKFCRQTFLPQRISSSKTCSPKFPPKKISFKKKIVPHFAPLIFILKNLLPKFFLPRICCQTFLLSIFLLSMIFYLQKSPPNYFCWRNFLLTRISPPKLGPQNFLSRKVALKRNCSPFCPPPKNFFSFKRICSPNISSQNLLPKIFALHITSHKKLLPKFCSPKIFAAQTTLWSSYGTWLIQVQWQGIVRCLRHFYWIFVICLKIVIEQKKHLDLQYVQGIPLQQLPGS